jgi:hypothetical protein
VNPIIFSCEATLAEPPERIAEHILDLGLWPGFEGYGPLPGIKVARFEARTSEVVGTRIRVIDTGGSSHVEEVVEWEPDRLIRLRMGEFSPPLSRLATHFDETFMFEQTGGRTRVVRRFELYPRSTATRPLLWLVSSLLKRAVTRHLRRIKAASRVPAGPSQEVGHKVTKLGQG